MYNKAQGRAVWKCNCEYTEENICAIWWENEIITIEEKLGIDKNTWGYF